MIPICCAHNVIGLHSWERGIACFHLCSADILFNSLICFNPPASFIDVLGKIHIRTWINANVEEILPHIEYGRIIYDWNILRNLKLNILKWASSNGFYVLEVKWYFVPVSKQCKWHALIFNRKGNSSQYLIWLAQDKAQHQNAKFKCPRCSNNTWSIQIALIFTSASL